MTNIPRKTGDKVKHFWGTTLYGWRTRILAVLVVLAGISEFLNPRLLATALGVTDASGQAWITIGLGAATLLLNEAVQAYRKRRDRLAEKRKGDDNARNSS